MLCNKTLSMFAFLSTDTAIANLFQGPELCSRLVNVMLYVAQNMLGSKVRPRLTLCYLQVVSTD